MALKYEDDICRIQNWIGFQETFESKWVFTEVLKIQYKHFYEHEELFYFSERLAFLVSKKIILLNN